jgi:allantoin racemase
MTSVLVLVPFPLDEAAVSLRRDQLESVHLDPNIKFDYRPVKAGPAWYDSDQDFVLADVAMLEAGQTAEQEGYDAVCLDTLSDSGLAALRSILRIPVIAPGLTAYLTALQLGNNFGILQQWRPWFRVMKKKLREYGLADKCVSMRSPDLRPDPENLLGGKEADVFPLLLEHGKKCIEDGAEVIILGSTTMHQAHSFLAEKLPVPVINPGPISYKMTEAILSAGLTHSRAAYPSPIVPQPEMLHAMMRSAAEIREI